MRDIATPKFIIAAGLIRRPRRFPTLEYVTQLTDTAMPMDAPAVRERTRLWRGQTAFSAVQVAGTIGLVWLSAATGGGPVAAALIIAASLLPMALGVTPATRLLAHVSRRTLLWSSQMAACVALGVAAVTGQALGTTLMVGAIAVVGCARMVFDAVAADVLQQLVPLQRTHEAMGDLTRRFGLGQVLGLAGTMVVGLAAGPRAAVLLGAVLAGGGAVLAFGHRPQIDLRPPEATPLHGAVGAGLQLIVRNTSLRAAVAAGAVSVAIGGALSAVLILWLRDGVGLRGTLVPTLMLGLVAVRLARPVLVRVARRVSSRMLVIAALAIQAAAALAAVAAGGAGVAAAAYALSLASGAFLATLITRAHTRVAPPAVAPGVGVVCGAVWALAAAVGAGLGAGLALILGMGEAYVVLAVVAVLGAVAAAIPAVGRAPTDP